MAFNISRRRDMLPRPALLATQSRNSEPLRSFPAPGQGPPLDRRVVAQQGGSSAQGDRQGANSVGFLASTPAPPLCSAGHTLIGATIRAVFRSRAIKV